MVGPSTIATHAGRIYDEYGAVNPPVVRASTILFSNYQEWQSAELQGKSQRKYGITYGRQGSVTSRSLQEAICQLEQAEYCLLTPCGLSAITASFMTILSSGDHVLVIDNVYGPVRRWLNSTGKRYGIEVDYFSPICTIDELAAKIRPNTRLIWLETPGSLTFELPDIPAICALAKQHGILTGLDNTWATGLYFPAYLHGVDVVAQAATKYICGHSDALMGVITTNCSNLSARLSRTHYDLGLCVSNDEAALVLRGLRTMPLRLAAHQAAALAMAQWFYKQDMVERVWHPALPQHPQHALFCRDFKGSSGLFSVLFRPNFLQEQLEVFVNELQYFGIGYSWGGYESLVLPFNLRGQRTYMPDWYQNGQLALRIHIGLEDIEDLKSDLEQAFEKALSR